ncbi:coiled-coil domain-containing protein 112-like [Copidosoma floridanum]|uniref:coiled-coil domain-containing protein 112-like n=1 Tax=Copidosoma floridanum TaxID=29053 RepID=UPI0006C93FF7|nr:coiled-coil domain-containing protein 112-like [Copidosoma floridanum]
MASTMNDTNSQHIKLYLRLKMQEIGIDKSLAVFINYAKSDVETWKSIKRDIDEFEKERQKIEVPLREKIIDVYQELKSVKEMMAPSNVKNIDLEVFKKKLQSLWKRVQEFKNSCTDIGNLANEQKNLSTELDELHRKIHKHENFLSNDKFYSRIISVQAALQRQDPNKECDFGEAENFFALISNSGHTGGWSEKDHLLYVKFRKKHKSTEALVSALRTKCPDLTEENIMKHDAWYKIYLDLREKQKIAVQEWRDRKEAERRRDRAPPPSTEKVKSPVVASSEKIAERNEAAIEKRKEILNKLKEKKEIQRFMNEERMRGQTKLKKEGWKIRRHPKPARITKIVKEDKPGGDREPSNQTVKQCRPSFKSSLFLQLYRARDKQYLEKRKKVLLHMNASKQTALPVDQDFSKYQESILFKETKAWQEKFKFEPKSTETFFYIKNVPGLGKSNETSDSSLNRHL